MSIRVFSVGVAALLLGGVAAARAGEVEATPVCRPYGPTTTYYGDPCCRVGPVRRFLRRVFHPCCPPPVRCAAPVVYAPVPVAAPCPAPCAAPTAWVPPAPAAGLDRPIAPPPPIDVPSSLKRAEPPTPTPPVRFDRIASRAGDGAESGHLVTLVQVGKPASRRQAETDAAGRFTVELTPGTWVVYVADASGRSVEKGRLVIREQKVVRVRIVEEG